jgi:hypothetical protein
MLQRHLAADEIAAGHYGVLGEEVLDAADPVRHFGIEPGGNEARVVADAAVRAELAQQGEELALAAADFQHVPAVQVMARDQGFGQLPAEGVEGRRIALRLLIGLGIDGSARFPGAVEDEAAAIAEAHPDVAGRKTQGVLAAVDQQATVRRDRRNLVEDFAPGGIAGGADRAHG